MRVTGYMAVLMLLAIGPVGAQAQQPKADCSKYHKLSDGRWTSTIAAKIGNPKSFIVLQPGIAIARDVTIVGLNVSDTLDRLCGSK